MNYENFLISEDSTILDSLNRLNSIRDVSRLILFVKDKQGKVIGSLTDGDVRRSLVKDKNLETKVGAICYRDFIFSYETKEFIDLASIKKNNIKILPILNKDKTLSRIVDLDKIKSLLPIECVIMAGGRGKRLSPLTDKVPKPMLPLGGKPIIEYNIDRLISFGIKKIYISVNYLGDQIQNYFGDGSSKGIEIEYVWEDKPLGTAGAMSLIKDIKSKHILLMNSDLFTNVDIETMYKLLIENKADMVIASKEYNVDVPYAVFDTNENSKINSFVEKPSYSYHCNAGIYLFTSNLLQKIPKNTFYDITELMEDLVVNKHKLIHKPIRGYWIDIGKPTDYVKAKNLIKHFY